MKKYFITSDTHSFFTPLKKALDKAGFDINNPEHIFVVCGDVFDRGFETKEIYNFIKSIPEDRRILIKGNHEILYQQLLQKSIPDNYDYSNGTVRTFCAIAGYKEEIASIYYWYERAIIENQPLKECSNLVYEYWAQIKEQVAMSDITTWINSDEWQPYWETDNYIFVHSFIPVNEHITSNKWGEQWKTEETSFREDWRYATPTEWEEATWGNPWAQAKEGLNKTGKTIVCGHWHTSDFFNNLKHLKEHYDLYKNPIFKSKKYKLIGLDACTAATNKVNVLVMDEDEL